MRFKCELEQLVFGSRSKIGDRRVYSAAASCNLHVRCACGAKLLLFISRPAKDCVGVRIDESRSENGAGAIDLARIRELSAKLFLRPDSGDVFAVYANRPSFLDTGVGHLAAFARATRPRARSDL